MVTGPVSAYSTIILFSFGPICLPRYSGVRPIMSPARNTAITAVIIMLKIPVPRPQRSPLLKKMTSRTKPPREVKLSFAALAEPVAVLEVTMPARAVPPIPNRTSLPSMLPRTGVDLTGNRRHGKAVGLRSLNARQQSADKKKEHNPVQEPSLAHMLHHPSKSVCQCAAAE